MHRIAVARIDVRIIGSTWRMLNDGMIGSVALPGRDPASAGPICRATPPPRLPPAETPSVQFALLRNDLADQPVFLGRVGIEPEIPQRIVLDPLDGLSGLTRKDPVQPLAHPDDFARFDRDVGC